jgi:hypothetical protein
LGECARDYNGAHPVGLAYAGPACASWTPGSQLGA